MASTCETVPIDDTTFRDAPLPGVAAPEEEAPRRLARAEITALVARARAGDRGAFDSLHRRHERMVHGVLLSLVPTVEADDLVQEVFLSAWTRLGSLRDESAFGAWLASIARRAAVDSHRSRRRPEALSDSLADRHASPADAAEAARILLAIRSMPEAYRETLALRLAEGLTGQEIAEQTGLTPGSVRVNLHRGMAMLRERLGAGGEP